MRISSRAGKNFVSVKIIASVGIDKVAPVKFEQDLAALSAGEGVIKMHSLLPSAYS